MELEYKKILLLFFVLIYSFLLNIFIEIGSIAYIILCFPVFVGTVIIVYVSIKQLKIAQKKK